MKKAICSVLCVLLIFSVLTPAAVSATDAISEENAVYEEWHGACPEAFKEKKSSVFNFRHSNKPTEQSVSDYNYLRDYLFHNGYQAETSYFLAYQEQSGEKSSSYFLTYFPSSQEIIFGARLLDGKINVYLEITPTAADGYGLIISSNIDEPIDGFAIVYPATYTNVLSFTLKNESNQTVTNPDLAVVLNSAFDLCLSRWNYILKYYPKMTMGNFGFTKLYTPASIGQSTAAATVAIKNKGNITVDYGTKIYVSATAKNLPDGAYLLWFGDPGDGSAQGESVSFSCLGDCVLYVVAVDSNGDILTDTNGNEIYDCETVTVRAGFFQKLLFFFRNLFGITKTYTQA